MYEEKRIYIVAKTYPTISKKHVELVCTAGIQEDGSWIRLYPVPFRKLDVDKQYPKYRWINCMAKRNQKDFRPETYYPDLDTIKIEPGINKVDWDERRNIIFKNNKVYTNLNEIILEAKTKSVSLGIFKPSKILDFVIEDSKTDWNPNTLQIIKNKRNQLHLFKSEDELNREFEIVRKIPYKFSYKFSDDEGRKSTMMISDWEIGMLYLNCLTAANNNEKEALKKVKEKYLDSFLSKDLFFFLGTTKKFHNVSPNPFIIIGVFYPPKKEEDLQMQLL